MSSTLFISDLHLDASRPELSRALAAFLQRHAHCHALYILGDLFEAWIGDDDDEEPAPETCRLLRRFSDRGPSLYLMHGNRDFLLGEEFARRAGATLIPDPTVIDLYGEPTLLMHGDSLCTSDTSYQAFRKQARDSRWQSEILARSLEERRALATQMRHLSKEQNSNKAEDIMDVTPAEVARVMAAHGVRQLIHGHTHRPMRHEEAHGLRWVLGDWGQKGWAIEASEDDIDIYNFDIDQ